MDINKHLRFLRPSALLLLLLILPGQNIPAAGTDAALPGRLLQKNERVTIDRILITGNGRTKDDVILKEFVFSEGDTIGCKEIDRTLKNLRNRKIFYRIEYSLSEEEDRTVFQLRLKEKWTLLPAISFRHDQTMTKLLFGAIDFNFLGQGSTVMFYFSPLIMSEGEVRHNYRLLYRQNRLGGSPFRLSVSGRKISQLRYVRSDEGDRIGSYDFDSCRIDAELGFSIKDILIPHIGIGYSDNRIDSRGSGLPMEIPDSYFQGFISPRGGIRLDLTDQTDHRKEGFSALTDMAPVFSLYGLGDSYMKCRVKAEYSDIFARNRLYYRISAGMDYAGSRYLSNYPVMDDYLRGSSAREYQMPLIFGGSAEFSVTPVIQPWIVLDLALFTDFAMGGENLSDSIGNRPRWRYGAGIRYSIPSIAHFLLKFDIALTENGDVEFVLSI